MIHILFIFFDYLIDKEVVYISHFVIKGHRAALKEFKANPPERAILVSKEGDVKCYDFEDWVNGLDGTWYRVDCTARLYYRVRSAQLSETMVKNTAIKILKGEL